MTEAIDLIIWSMRRSQSVGKKYESQSITSKIGICLCCPMMLGGAREHENHWKLAHLLHRCTDFDLSFPQW